MEDVLDPSKAFLHSEKNNSFWLMGFKTYMGLLFFFRGRFGLRKQKKMARIIFVFVWRQLKKAAVPLL